MKPNKLYEKYYNGTSELKEEEQLRNRSEDLLLKALYSYKKPDSSYIEHKISNNLSAKNKYRKLIITVGTAAAMLIGLLSIPMFNYHQNKIAEQKVEAILTSQEYTETLKMSHQMISKLTHFIDSKKEQSSALSLNIKFSIPTLSRLESKIK